MYSYFYRLIQNLILKKSFNEDIIKLIKQHSINNIIDIGCADSTILNNLENKYFYHGFELDKYIETDEQLYNIMKKYM
mgnify:CR=1 FL=1